MLDSTTGRRSNAQRSRSYTVAAPERTSSKQQPGRGFRLAQISDCHLPASADKPYRGLRADSGLEQVLAAVAGWQADAVLVTGDLSEDASESSYQRLAGCIAELDVPVLAIPGNHDLPVLMQRYFPQGPYPGSAVLQAGDWQVLLLDSARPGRIDGSIDAQQLEQLEQQLQSGVPALLVLHHQPVVIGSPWIDKYRLEQPEALLEFVAEHEEIKAVLWGHVHQAFDTQIGSTRFMSAPSTAANSLPGHERFTHDPAGPACRWLELYVDGTLETGILYAM
jgi:Icc protein